ncbi:hypothetical protein HT031_001203 [Scenedesmus sp. PABB004]|nr:hypothetical protein HT031_001203 [Scenedesmus sp. PABB004]
MVSLSASARHAGAAGASSRRGANRGAPGAAVRQAAPWSGSALPRAIRLRRGPAPAAAGRRSPPRPAARTRRPPPTAEAAAAAARADGAAAAVARAQARAARAAGLVAREPALLRTAAAPRGGLRRHVRQINQPRRMN